MAEQFNLENELPLFVLLRVIVGTIVLPTNHLFTLSATYVSYDMFARGHVAFSRVTGNDVHNCIEKVSLPMLAAEVLDIRSWLVDQGCRRVRLRIGGLEERDRLTRLMISSLSARWVLQRWQP